MPPKRKVKKAAPKGKKATKATSKTTTLQPENDAAREDHSEIVKVVEKHPTGFLDLPTEIRNVIYQLALIRYHKYVVYKGLCHCFPRFHQLPWGMLTGFSA